MNFMKRTHEPTIAGNAIGFAFDTIFMRGIELWLEWVFAFPFLMNLSLGLLYLLSFKSLSEYDISNWSTLSLARIITIIWLYTILVPGYQRISLLYYDTYRVRLLPLVSPLKMLFFFLTFAMPHLLIEEIIRRNMAGRFSYLADNNIVITALLCLLSLATLYLFSRIIFSGCYILDKNYNPITAIQASWNMTRDKSARTVSLVYIGIAIIVLINTHSNLDRFTSNPYIVSEDYFRWLESLGWLMVNLMTIYIYRHFEKNAL